MDYISAGQEVRSADFVKDDKKSAKAKRIGRYDKFEIKDNTGDNTALNDEVDYKEVLGESSKKALARLLQKVYEIDPFLCPHCDSEMKIIAVI